MRALGRYIVNRIKEPSTWAGISVIATIAGVPPGSVDLAYQLFTALVGLGAVFMPDPKAVAVPAPPAAPAAAESP